MNNGQNLPSNYSSRFSFLTAAIHVTLYSVLQGNYPSSEGENPPNNGSKVPEINNKRQCLKPLWCPPSPSEHRAPEAWIRAILGFWFWKNQKPRYRYEGSIRAECTCDKFVGIQLHPDSHRYSAWILDSQETMLVVPNPIKLSNKIVALGILGIECIHEFWSSH